MREPIPVPCSGVRLPIRPTPGRRPEEMDWDFSRPHEQVLFRAPSLHCRSLIAATDGSTEQSDGSSGWGLTIAEGESTAESAWVDRCGPILGYSDNYVAELAAVLALLVIVPVDIHLHVLTDSQSAVDALRQCRAQRSFRSRVNQPGRPVLETVRRIVAARSACGSRTRFAWVRAHTGCQDFASRLNHRADRAANRGRLLCHPDGRHFPRSAARFDWMEEDVLFLTPEGQFLGRPRTYLAAAHRRGKVEEWRRLPVQGELLRDGGCPDAILGQARALRKFDSSSLLCFFLLGITQWLHTHHRLYKGLEECARGCPFCFQGANETFRHMLACPARREIRLRAAETVRHILSSLGPCQSRRAPVHPGLEGSPIADPVTRVATMIAGEVTRPSSALGLVDTVVVPDIVEPDGQGLILDSGTIAKLPAQFSF